MSFGFSIEKTKKIIRSKNVDYKTLVLMLNDIGIDIKITTLKKYMVEKDRGGRKPSVEMVQALSRVLDVEIDELLVGEQNDSGKTYQNNTIIIPKTEYVQLLKTHNDLMNIRRIANKTAK